MRRKIVRENLIEVTSSPEELKIAREILGETVRGLSDIELQKVITKFDHLTDLFMEDFEKSIFNGKTLNELVKTD
jgi:hypothetical protein